MIAQQITPIDTQEIIPGTNDRTTFDHIALAELADSIRDHDLIQPITVRWLDDAGCYQIVAGERRFRACKDILGWDEIPAIIADATDEEASALMLAENVSRQDLDPIDEATAYSTRMKMYGWTIADCARRAGVSTTRIRFRIKLLNLRPELQKLVRDSQLALGYAQILSYAELDTNRQMIAVSRLRNNPRPTPSWFRKEVSTLKEEQAQGALFDTAIFTACQADAASATMYQEPPHPTTTTPPLKGGTVRDMLINQIAFWRKAAEAWNDLGKPFKRQECEAASQALTFALAAL